MTVYVDTSIIMYAGGAAHPHRRACRRVLQQIADGRLAATTSTEVVQEILHRFSRTDRTVGAAMAHSVIQLFGDLLAIDRQTIADTVERFRRNDQLSARDAIHAAACRRYDIDIIVSTDSDFDRVADLSHRAPDEF